MPAPKKENHHFLPRCYLRQFSGNGKYVHVYSKKHQRNNSVQGIRNVAVKENFYRISLESIQSENKSPADVNFFEKEFFDNIVEKRLAPLLMKINQKMEQWRQSMDSVEVLEKKDKDTFAALIAIQYLRMPNIRDKYCSFAENLSHARLEIMKSFLSSQFTDNKDFINTIKLDYDRKLDPEIHAEIFADQETIDKIQDCLLDKYWIFFVSPDDDFYTSDNPVLLQPHLPDWPFRWEGFDRKGVEIIFPVSSSVLLTMWDKQYFPQKAVNDNRFILIDAKEKRKYNCCQYIWANEEVYSKNNNFQLIELLKQANGLSQIIMQKPVIKVYS